jgi:hypothetical protein
MLGLVKSRQKDFIGEYLIKIINSHSNIITKADLPVHKKKNYQLDAFYVNADNMNVV